MQVIHHTRTFTTSWQKFNNNNNKKKKNCEHNISQKIPKNITLKRVPFLIVGSCMLLLPYSRRIEGKMASAIIQTCVYFVYRNQDKKTTCRGKWWLWQFLRLPNIARGDETKYSELRRNINFVCTFVVHFISFPLLLLTS